MNCPVCSAENSKRKYLIGNFEILSCCNCGHLYSNIDADQSFAEQVYSDDYFYGGKDGYPDYTRERDILIRSGERYAKKIRQYISGGKMLDIGSAAGFIMKGFQNKGWIATGIEINRSMVRYGRTQLNLDIREGSFENTELMEKYNLVTMIQVIAHLFDLQRSIKKINKYLVKDGFVLIETWNKDSFSARLFGKNWHEFSPPSTLNFFSKKTLDLLMKTNGFKKVAGGRPRKFILSKHAKELVRHKIANNKYLKWMKGLERILPDNLPIPYPSEDLFWALYQK